MLEYMRKFYMHSQLQSGPGKLKIHRACISLQRTQYSYSSRPTMCSTHIKNVWWLFVFPPSHGHAVLKGYAPTEVCRGLQSQINDCISEDLPGDRTGQLSIDRSQITDSLSGKPCDNSERLSEYRDALIARNQNLDAEARFFTSRVYHVVQSQRIHNRKVVRQCV